MCAYPAHPAVTLYLKDKLGQTRCYFLSFVFSQLASFFLIYDERWREAFASRPPTRFGEFPRSFFATSGRLLDNGNQSYLGRSMPRKHLRSEDADKRLDLFWMMCWDDFMSVVCRSLGPWNPDLTSYFYCRINQWDCLLKCAAVF